MTRWGAFRRKRDNKYGNVPTRVDGRMFHSKKEAARYLELRALENAGLITELECQPRFRLEVGGVHICNYIADFRYSQTVPETGLIIEDVKSPGTRTREYELKRRLMLAIHGIEILET